MSVTFFLDVIIKPLLQIFLSNFSFCTRVFPPCRISLHKIAQGLSSIVREVESGWERACFSSLWFPLICIFGWNENKLMGLMLVKKKKDSRKFLHFGTTISFSSTLTSAWLLEHSTPRKSDKHHSPWALQLFSPSTHSLFCHTENVLFKKKKKNIKKHRNEKWSKVLST